MDPPPPPPLDRAHPPAVLFTAIAREDVRPEEGGQDILELANEQSVRITEDVDEHWYRYEDIWESISCDGLDFSWGDQRA